MSAEPRRYGQWAGNPQGQPERLMDCREEVWPEHGMAYQCQRKRGHGLNGWFCKQHAKRHPVAVAAGRRA